MFLAKLNDRIDKILGDRRQAVLFVVLTMLICLSLATIPELLIFNKILPHRGEFYFSWTRFVSIAIVFFVATLLAKYHRYFLAHLEYAFLVIAISMGILFVLVLPKTVHVSQDDQIHLQHAYALLSSSEVKWSKAFRMLELSSTSVEGLSFAEIDKFYDQLNTAHKETQDQRADFGDNSLLFSRLVYLPYFIGFKVSEFLHLNFTSMITVAKLCNLLCYVFILFFAIKISTHAKKIFFILGLLLSNLFYASQFSYDPATTASIMLAIALFLRMLELQYIPPRYIVIFVLAVVWASLPKAIYCPILLLLLFVPRRKFGSQKRALACKVTIISMTILLASTFILPMLSGSMAGDFRGGDTSVSQQILYILHNPLRSLATFAKFTTNNLPELIMVQPISVGIYLPYLYTSYVLPIINLMYIIILGYVTFTSRKSSKAYTRPVRIASLLIYVVVVYSAIGAMYLSFTPVGADTIEGFQERYLLPILPLALILLVPMTKLPAKLSEETSNFAILAVPFLSLVLFLGCFILKMSTL